MLRHTVAGIAYHDYLAVLCTFDDSQSLRMGSSLDLNAADSGLSLKASRDFTTACQKYRRRVQRHANDFHETNETPGKSPQIEPYFYNPACFLAFGHADASAIVLLDSFDPLLWITSEVGPPLQQTTPAFCPTLESLGLEGDSHFAELHVLLGKAQPIENDPVTNEASASDPDVGYNSFFDPAEHAFHREQPLVAITRFKASGLLPLGHGLLLQQALFRAIAARVKVVLAELRHFVIENPNTELLSVDDIDSFKIVMLDVQGSEDIATLTLCRNYTVAINVITALRGLTFRDLIEVEPETVKPAIQSDGLHRNVLRVLKELDETWELPPDNILWDNHVFSITYTSLGVAFSAFRDAENDEVQWNGFVEAYGFLDILPGHLKDTEENWRNALRQCKPHEQCPDNADKVNRFMVGRHDYKFSLAVDPDSGERGRLISIKDFIRRSANILRTFKCSASKDKRTLVDLDHPVYETGLRDSTTLIVVPFPEIGTLSSSKGFHVPLLPVLEATRRKLFGRYGPLDQIEMQKRMREIGIPRPLRRTITYLFQNYGDCLADLSRFHMVADLHDSFVTLYSLLTHDIPERNGSSELPPRRAVRLENAIVDDLVKFLSALQNALLHREYMAVPSTEERDKAVDLRGGLNKLVAASDVSLKCGLNIVQSVKRHQQIQKTSAPEARESEGRERGLRHRITAVSRITFHPQTTIEWLLFTNSTYPHLARVDMSAIHLFRPEDHPLYLHEAAHLLYEDGERVKEPTPHERLRADRREELFAELVTHFFIYGTDSSIYLRHFFTRCSMAPGVVHQDDTITKDRFSELLIRAFLVSDAINEVAAECSNPWEMSERHTLYNKENGSSILRLTSRRKKQRDSRIIHARDRFKDMVREFGPFFCEFDRLWYKDYKDIVSSAAMAEFPDRYCDGFGDLVAVWQQALKVFKVFYREKFEEQRGEDSEEQIELMKDISVAFAEARPLLFARPEKRENKFGIHGYEREFFKCQLMYAYLSWCYGSLDTRKELYTYRDPETGSVEYKDAPDGKKKWNNLHFDTNYGGFFIVEPGTRCAMLRRRIVVLKTLWDLSTNLRNITVNEIFESLWSEPDSE